MLKLLHTADWHLGLRFRNLGEADELKLTRARLDVVERILGVAERNQVDAVLCAGDLFDDPEPVAEWWRGLADCLARPGWPAQRPVILLPGNHDPLLPGSVWGASHPFRQALPEWVRVVDHDGFTCELGPDAVVLATPCRSRAGDRDPTAALPLREPGDERLRIGLVHGQTFDIEGHQTNFPIARQAGQERGLDYLALGDTHSFREVDCSVPTIYPGAPEPTKLREPEAGHVALVLFRRRGRLPRIIKERVGRWTWQERTCRDLASLRALAGTSELSQWVLRLVLEMSVTLPELHEVESLLDQLGGTAARHNRAGVLLLDRSRLSLAPSALVEDFGEQQLPAVLRTVVERLAAIRDSSSDQDRLAERALWHLYRLIREEL
jgi:predicted phosphodiesterase